MATETGFDWWHAVSAVAAFLSGSGLLAGGRWVFRMESKQHEHETWRRSVDSQLQKGDAEISATHDAVIVLQTNVETLTGVLDEVKDGQKSVLERLAELISRPV